MEPFSVAWIVKRVIEETAANPQMKQLGETHLFTLRRLQVLPIGAKDARKLTRQDIIEFAKSLRATVKAATVAQYVGYLGGALDTASATWDDCSEVSRECIRKARPFLQKNGRFIASVCSNDTDNRFLDSIAAHPVGAPGR